MSYRCTVCEVKVAPGQPQRRHVVYRERPALRGFGAEATTILIRQIAREVPVCGSCHKLLEDGVPLFILVNQKGQIRRENRPTVPEPVAVEKVLETPRPEALFGRSLIGVLTMSKEKREAILARIRNEKRS